MVLPNLKVRFSQHGKSSVWWGVRSFFWVCVLTCVTTYVKVLLLLGGI